MNLEKYMPRNVAVKLLKKKDKKANKILKAAKEK